MLGILSAYLPAPAGPLPAPTISVTSLTERTAGMGNYRGTEARGEFPAVELKGIRVDAVTRFQLWAQDPAQADTDVTALASQLAVDADTLWGKGFLKFTLDAVPPAEVIPSLTAWRKHADYRVLFEYAYTDAGTDSLIAQIPIDIDGEKTLVTDEMTRWDQEHAPALVVRGPFTAGTLSLLLFVPGVKPTGSVTVTRTFDGAVGLPPTHPNLADFLTAVAGPAPAQRHASVTFATFGDFVTLPIAVNDGNDFAMGDWNNDLLPDMYEPRRIPLGAGIALPRPEDRLEVAYQPPPLDNTAVMYMRAARGQ
jgi:hypothetical protein